VEGFTNRHREPSERKNTSRQNGAENNNAHLDTSPRKRWVLIKEKYFAAASLKADFGGEPK